MSETAKESWGSGGAYELWVGRWSRKVAEEFIDWLAVSPGRTWGDVGCGTGALVERILGKLRSRGCPRNRPLRSLRLGSPEQSRRLTSALRGG